MKTLILFLIFIIPLLSSAQKVVILSVNQPSEFGFSVSKQDTTIIEGNSVVLGTDIIVFGGSGEYQYRWSPAKTLDDSIIVNPVANPLDTTTYLLTVTDNFGCSFSLNYTVNVKTATSINQQFITSEKLNAVLYPNPNDGVFKVKLTGLPVEKIELTIFDNTGKLVKRQTILNFTGDHTEMLQLKLVSGIYTLRIESGTETLSRQFIIN